MCKEKRCVPLSRASSKFSTINELVPAMLGRPINKGSIHSSNKFTLQYMDALKNGVAL